MRAILTYHSIDDSGSPISVDRAAFREHVAFLASGAVRVTDIAGVLAQPEDAQAVALTFDDAFANFATEAWPLLRDRGLPAMLFVVSGHAGGTNAWGGREQAGIPTLPLLDWDDLGRLAEEGVTLGAHSRTHPDLRGTDDAALADEVAGSADVIAARTGRRPEAFAYPYGAQDTRVASAAAAAYRFACTTDLRLLARDEEALLLPRLDAYYLRGPGRLARWGTPALTGYLRLRAATRALRAAVRGP
jgi:peptidoglycan/xylan/chitin deacetylase (PgdA/CDA1 family)